MTPDQLRAEAARLTAQATALETVQLDRAALKAMTPDEIEAARANGQLDSLLNITRNEN